MTDDIDWQAFAYLLAAALADEVHYSQTPSEDSLELLERAAMLFANTDLEQRMLEMEIQKLTPVE